MNSARFPEYGDGGDQIGSRRTRRAFRFFVAACLLLTGGLWFAEQFLRHNQTERLYLRALTLDPASARPFLRQAVKLDERLRQLPTPKYWLALADREEDDRVLDTFEQAYRLDPDNAALCIRYGCRLLEHRRPVEARARFREAAENAPDNALPIYLEAAALPWMDEENDDPRRSLAMVAKANSSGQTISMPRPLWFSDLPQDGFWYAELRRGLIHRASEPLRQYVDYIGRKAEESIETGQTQYWDSWLEHIEGMGERMIADAVHVESTGQPLAGAAVQALHGVEIQLAAVTLRERIRESEGVVPDEALTERRNRLEEAQNRLQAFEEKREARIAADMDSYWLPLVLIGHAVGLFLLLMSLSLLLTRFAREGKPAWTLSHGRLGIFGAAGGAFAAFLVLCAISIFQQTGGLHADGIAFSQMVWWGILALLTGMGLVYPFIQLPSPKHLSRERGDEAGRVRHEARRRRRLAYLVLVRRSYGLAAGLMAVAICGWIIWHRVVVSLYPWQIKLLVGGLVDEEVSLVRQLVAFLQ